MAACTRDLEVLAFVLIPDLSVLIPGGVHRVPCSSRIVALGTVAGPQIGMAGLVAIAALATESCKVGVLVALEARCLAMSAW